MMGFGMGIGLPLMLVFWGLLIVGAAWLIKGVFSGGGRPLGTSGESAASPPREILDQRYSRGEIAREEYERIRQDLGL
jgi:uncharacterized membrane protein